MPAVAAAAESPALLRAFASIHAAGRAIGDARPAPGDKSIDVASRLCNTFTSTTVFNKRYKCPVPHDRWKMMMAGSGSSG